MPHATQGSRASWQLDVEWGGPLPPTPHSRALATALVLGQHGICYPSQNAMAGRLGWVSVAKGILVQEAAPFTESILSIR